MRKLRKVAIVSALAALTFAGAPLAAAQAADGNFYAWRDVNYGGPYCAWQGDDSNWSTCSPGGNMLNQASSVWNNGYAETYDDVNVYWGSGYSGASKCIGRGGYIADLSYYTFPYNGTGGGETLNNNIASHKWVLNSTC